VCRRKVDAVAREPERGLDDADPGKPTVFAPQELEPRRQAGHTAGRRPDGVVHELGAEPHLKLKQLDVASVGAETWDGDEAVQVARPAARRIEVDCVAASEQPGHHGLGDA